MTYRLAQVADMDRVYDMMYQEVENGRDGFFVPETEDTKPLHVSSTGVTLLCEKDSVLVGYLIMRKPHNAQDNLARDIDLMTCEHSKVAHMESLLVESVYRGQGIGRDLMSRGEQLLVAEGYCHLMATVHPDNIGSLKTMTSLGYQNIMTKEKYGGHIRHIMHKQI